MASVWDELSSCTSRGLDHKVQATGKKTQPCGYSTHVGSFDLDLHSSANHFTSTAIYAAITNRNLSQLQYCLNKGEDVSAIDEECGSSYMIQVVNSADYQTELQAIAMIHELALAGCDPNIIDYKGQTALTYAISHKLSQVMVSLLQVGAEGSSTCEELIMEVWAPDYTQVLDCYKKHTPSLWSAVENADYKTVQRLINNCCRINIAHRGVLLVDSTKKLYGRDHIITDLLITHFHALECFHAVIAGNRRILQDFLDNYNCSMAFATEGSRRNFGQSFKSYSLFQMAKKHGHRHLLDLLTQSDSAAKKAEPVHTHSRLCSIS